MSKRKIELVVLCEDKQHQAFIKYYLRSRGMHNFRFLAVPQGKKSGEQYVRENYAKEVFTIRKTFDKLIVMIDADSRSVKERLQHFDDQLEKHGQVKRQTNDKIAIFIPKRNIETWIRYFMGEKVDETEKNRTKLKDPEKCKPFVEKLATEICPIGLPVNAPPSLHLACDELKRIL